jgi:hypothetical protein
LSWTPRFGKFLGESDVFVLRAFVTTAQQNDDRSAATLEIDAITGPVMNAKLTDAFANRTHVTREAVD